ncbi:MAG: Gfo/Idh/MocA family oxidoreductase [Terriglobia bacterium]
MAERIRVGVLGVGEHGKHHARQYTEIEPAHLAGVYDIRPERCQQVAAELGVRAFSSVEEALRAVQAASIVIPTTEHAAVARRAFELGVDVLLEKPITRTVEEADELIKVAESCGRILQVGHIERFNPGVVAAKAITQRPLFFEVHRLGVFSPRSLDVDVVYDLMIHDLDLVLWMVGAAPRQVHAVGLPVLTNKVDIANARVEFENGAVANFTASRVSTEKVRKFRYFQPNEYVSIDFSRQDALVIGVDRTKMNPEMSFRKLETRPIEPLRAEIEAFLESVRTRRAPLAGGREGRAALALAADVMDRIERHAAEVQISLSRAVGHAGEI